MIQQHKAFVQSVRPMWGCCGGERDLVERCGGEVGGSGVWRGGSGEEWGGGQWGSSFHLQRLV